MTVPSRQLSFVALLTVGCAGPTTFGRIDGSVQSALRIDLAIETEGYEHPPTFAIWVEAESGALQTVYVTRKAARNAWTGSAVRPEALPIWYAVRAREGRAGDAPPVDGITSASPTGEQFTVWWPIPPSFRVHASVFIEANHSFDYNDFYSRSRRPDEAGYSGDNGQPSIVWSAFFPAAAGAPPTAIPTIVGCVEVQGKSSDIYRDLAHVTTARRIFRGLTFRYEPAERGPR